MRFDLRLHGRTSDGQKCQAVVSVHANSQARLQKEAKLASETAAWRLVGSDSDVPEGAHITVEHVEALKKKQPRKT